MNKAQKGAAVGAGGGAVIGGLIGKAAGNTAAGAIIGAAVGGTAGAIIGNQMDKQAAELEQELEDVEIERVGEGIQITFDSGILFAFNSSDLSADARSNLSNLAESLQKYPQSDLLIVGHTDSVGAKGYNYRLSEQRADAAGDYLMDLGIARSRISTVGKGMDEPVDTNETEAGRQNNRRVEIAIFASEEYRQEVMDQN